MKINITVEDIIEAIETTNVELYKSEWKEIEDALNALISRLKSAEADYEIKT